MSTASKDLTSESAKTRRQEVLDASLDHFSRLGHTETSVRQIALPKLTAMAEKQFLDWLLALEESDPRREAGLAGFLSEDYAAWSVDAHIWEHLRDNDGEYQHPWATSIPKQTANVEDIHVGMVKNGQVINTLYKCIGAKQAETNQLVRIVEDLWDDKVRFLPDALPWDSVGNKKEFDRWSDGIDGDDKYLLGVRDGIFHAEAQIRNSSVHYASALPEADDSTGSSDLVDLVPRPTPPTEEPTVVLREVKPKPPSMWGNFCAMQAHGIDYDALYMMCPLGEWERFRKLVRPFPLAGVVSPEWVNCVFVNVRTGCDHPYDNLSVVLEQKRPDLMSYCCDPAVTLLLMLIEPYSLLF
ncbi:glutathione synthetase ATP-binding domain-like protein [Apiospora phragmitis]|uniref:Glutathione synthetase ATP-binding domain-like protein n=1 Tax=Apiospora phragmitis TaxID=2905665 RepID=A0ABR1VCE9_9PEZI